MQNTNANAVRGGNGGQENVDNSSGPEIQASERAIISTARPTFGRLADDFQIEGSVAESPSSPGSDVFSPSPPASYRGSPIFGGGPESPDSIPEGPLSGPMRSFLKASDVEDARRVDDEKLEVRNEEQTKERDQDDVMVANTDGSRPLHFWNQADIDNVDDGKEDLDLTGAFIVPVQNLVDDSALEKLQEADMVINATRTPHLFISDDKNHDPLEQDHDSMIRDGFKVYQWQDEVDKLNGTTPGAVDMVEESPQCTIPGHEEQEQERYKAVAKYEACQTQSTADRDLAEQIIVDLHSRLEVAGNQYATLEAEHQETVVKTFELHQSLRQAKSAHAAEESQRKAVDSNTAELVTQLRTARAALVVADSQRQHSEEQITDITARLDAARTGLSTAQTDLVEEQSKGAECQKRVLELKGKPERKVVKSSSTGHMCIVEGDEYINGPEIALTLEECIAEASQSSANAKLAAERLANGDCGYEPHANLVENLNAAIKKLANLGDQLKAGERRRAELETAVEASRKSEISDRKASEAAESERTDLITKLADSNHALRMAETTLKTAENHRSIPPAYQIAMQDAEDELKTVKKELQNSQKGKKMVPFGCYKPEHATLDGRIKRHQAERDALQEIVNKHVASTQKPDETCNISMHKDLQATQDALQKTNQSLKQKMEDLRKARPGPEECQNPRHRRLMASKKALQVEYDSLYDYAYMIQQDGWALLNHLAVQPLG